ncbi:hypothetical protein AAX05_10090 [Moraxella bovoculi]|uniref:Histidine phosphatase family protein n=1 Tax=Moraxella bovoculi TaxID=386891 RepID=A0AAC8T8N0_9GAMM|nr:histidine phosphatase family protein [Moraxella bovoculi]AKG08585.1 hypothetical protein AAX06_11085 [Moraxella bovoculi]AKG10421.1 hypothetical protein AAX05_10090 [Moraxella bovoculi]AKG12447.1 hypothetical protein AAX07_11335 [Moraxella bovoculi]AKG14407.1 hypothetical protein AAX11_10775 [Moraxella bovoculi]
MKKFYLIRHAQSESNARLAIRPNPVINLTDVGRMEAEELSEWLSINIQQPIDGVFTSHYVRTAQTAAPFLAQLGSTAKVIEALHEFDYLDFDRIKDLSFEDLIATADNFWQQGDTTYQDGTAEDTYERFVERVRTVRQMFDELPDGNYVVFTHGMWIGMLMWQIIHGNGTRMMDMPAFRAYELAIRPKNCEVYLLTDAQGVQSVAKVRVRDE